MTDGHAATGEAFKIKHEVEKSNATDQGAEIGDERYYCGKADILGK